MLTPSTGSKIMTCTVTLYRGELSGVFLKKHDLSIMINSESVKKQKD